jgi:hypothetical protein
MNSTAELWTQEQMKPNSYRLQEIEKINVPIRGFVYGAVFIQIDKRSNKRRLHFFDYL